MWSDIQYQRRQSNCFGVRRDSLSYPLAQPYDDGHYERWYSHSESGEEVSSAVLIPTPGIGDRVSTTTRWIRAARIYKDLYHLEGARGREVEQGKELWKIALYRCQKHISSSLSESFMLFLRVPCGVKKACVEVRR